MSGVFFISDLHLGHRNLLRWAGKYRGWAKTIEEHDQILLERIKSVVTKRDKLYVLGDIVLSNEVDINILEDIPGDKILIRGNHDNKLNAKDYLEVFKDVYGVLKYKKHWLSHAPIHPAELRGKGNIHGHVHQNSIRDHYHLLDKRYVNVCVEPLNGYPIRYDQILSGDYWKVQRC